MLWEGLCYRVLVLAERYGWWSLFCFMLFSQGWTCKFPSKWLLFPAYFGLESGWDLL